MPQFNTALTRLLQLLGIFSKSPAATLTHLDLKALLTSPHGSGIVQQFVLGAVALIARLQKLQELGLIEMMQDFYSNKLEESSANYRIAYQLDYDLTTLAQEAGLVKQVILELLAEIQKHHGIYQAIMASYAESMDQLHKSHTAEWKRITDDPAHHPHLENLVRHLHKFNPTHTEIEQHAQHLAVEEGFNPATIPAARPAATPNKQRILNRPTYNVCYMRDNPHHQAALANLALHRFAATNSNAATAINSLHRPTVLTTIFNHLAEINLHHHNHLDHLERLLTVLDGLQQRLDAYVPQSFSYQPSATMPRFTAN